MVSTTLHQSSCGPTLGFTAEALQIINRVEREIIRHEMILGRAQLLEVVGRFGREAYATHTSYYRRVIRETVWPHGLWVSGAHSDFLRGFEYSALGYVWCGFEALRFFMGSSDASIDEVYADALVAESLRGQFGKSSPDGLDRRLEQLEDSFLDEYGDEEDLVALCTPAAPIRPAESALVEDFAHFRNIFPIPPTVDDVLHIAGPHRAKVWQFLRRHMRWNVEAAASLYNGFASATPVKETDTRGEHNRRRRDRIMAGLPEAAIALVDAITSLNVLNLVLEPAFSFKGCVGLPIGMIFRLVQHVERRPPLDQVHLLLGKWNLFNLAPHRSRND